MNVKWILLSGVDHFPLSDGKSFSWRRTGTAKNTNWQSNLLVTFIKSLDRRKLPVNKSWVVDLFYLICHGFRWMLLDLFPLQELLEAKSKCKPPHAPLHYDFLSFELLVHFLTKKSILNYFGLIHQPWGIVLIYHFQFIIISAIPQQAFQREDGD